jgi:hypothetical protein
MSLHEEGSDQANDASEETFEEEDVTPVMESHGRNTEFGDPDETSSQQATESACKRTGGDEDTNTEQQFVSLVEAGEEERDTRHGTTLGQTQECSCDEKAGVCLHECSTKRNQAKGEDQERNPESWSDSLEDNVRRNLDAVMVVSVGLSYC